MEEIKNKLRRAVGGSVHVSGGFIFADSFVVEEDGYFKIFLSHECIATFPLGAVHSADFSEGKPYLTVVLRS